jgi:hypothetical protein
MTPSEKLALLNPIRYALAALIVMGGAMHLIGLIMALLHRQRLVWVCWFFYFFAILVYPISSGMIFRNTQWGYWIAAVAPCVGGLFIFLGFFWPDTGFLKLLAGTVEKEITWVGFVQVTSESMAVAYAVLLIYHKVWQLH